MKPKRKKNPYDRRKQYSTTSVLMNYFDHLGLLSAKVRKFINKSSSVLNRPHERVFKIFKGSGEIDDALIQKAQKLLDSVTVEVNGYEMNAQIFWAMLYPALRFIGRSASRIADRTADKKQHAKRAREKLIAEWVEQFELTGRICDQYCPRGDDLELIHCNTFKQLSYMLIDSSTLGDIYSFDSSEDDDYWRIIVCRDRKTKTLQLPDGDRIGYAIAWPGRDRSTWLKLNIESIGPKMELPVYAQRHVIDRMAERLSVANPSHWALMSLCNSIKNPVIFKQDDSCDSFLLECRTRKLRIGYFGCQIVGNAVLVNTFLFLTMDGTPEGAKFRRILRLRRQDREYLGLDKISAFLHTDLRSDAYLVSLMKECGCDHIFALRDDLKSCPDISLADEMRRYLKIKPRITRDTNELARALETSQP